MKTNSNSWARKGDLHRRPLLAGCALLLLTGVVGSGCAVVDAFDRTPPVSPPTRRVANATSRPVPPGSAVRRPAYSIVDRPAPYASPREGSGVNRPAPYDTAAPQTKPALAAPEPWVERTPTNPPEPVPPLPPVSPQTIAPETPVETEPTTPPPVPAATLPTQSATMPAAAQLIASKSADEPAQASPIAPEPAPAIVDVPPIASTQPASAPATTKTRTPEQQKIRDKIAALKEKFQKGVDINEKDESGRTLLQQAAIAGELETVELLLDWGANVKDVDRQGWTALHWAASCGNQEICELLIASGSAVNARGYLDETPLYWAAVFDRRDTVALLLARGSEVNAADKRGKTPLHAAIEGDARSTAVVLLAHGANVKAVDEAGLTPLHQVVLQLRKTLLTLSDSEAAPATETTATSASVDRKQQRRSAISSAEEMINLLLKNQADVNAVTPGGVTPLHLAAWDDTKEIASVLLAAGGDPGVKDTRGRTPADYAKGRGQELAAVVLTKDERK